MRRVTFIFLLIAIGCIDAWLLATHKPHRALFLATVSGLFGAALLSPAFWKMVWGPTQNPSEKISVSTPMSRRRILAAYAVILFILGGSFLDLARDTEHWPWSCYPMYSYPETGTTFDDFRLYGVPAKNPNTEISLFTDERFIQPFDQSRISGSLELTSWRPGIREGLMNCLQRYERLRCAGCHNGPVLTGLRLYKVHWTLDPWGATVEKPDTRVLISEVTLPPSGKS